MGAFARADDLRLPDPNRDTVVQPTDGLLKQAQAGPSGASGDGDFRETDPVRQAVHNAFSKLHTMIGDPNTLEPGTQAWLQLLEDRAALIIADQMLHPRGGNRLVLDPQGLTLQMQSLDPLTNQLGSQFDRATPLGTSLALPTLADAGYAALAGPFNLQRKDLDKLDSALLVGGGAGFIGVLAGNGLGFSGRAPLFTPKKDSGPGVGLDYSLDHFGLGFDPRLRTGLTLTYKFDKSHSVDMHFDVANLNKELQQKYEGGVGVQIDKTHVGLGGGIASYDTPDGHHVVDLTGIIGLNRMGFGLHHGEIDGTDGRVIHNDATVSDSWQFMNGSFAASLTGSQFVDTTKPLLVDNRGLTVSVIGTTGINQRYAANGVASLGVYSDVSHCLHTTANLSFQVTDTYTRVSALVSGLIDPNSGEKRAEFTVTGPLPTVFGVSDNRYAEEIAVRLALHQPDLGDLEDELLALPGSRLRNPNDAEVKRLRAKIAELRQGLYQDYRRLVPLAVHNAEASKAQRTAAIAATARLTTLITRVRRLEDELSSLPGARMFDTADPEANELRGRIGQVRQLLRENVADIDALGPHDPGLNGFFLERAREEAAEDHYGADGR